jgi:hypothetical protein
VSVRDSYQNPRRHEDLSNRRKTIIEQNEVTELKTRGFRMQFAFTLYFTSHNLVTLYWHLFISLSQLSGDNLELWSDAIRKLIFSPFFLQILKLFALSLAKRCGLRY